MKEHHLLWTSRDGHENASIYTQGEFDEAFTAQERAALLAGKTIHRQHGIRVTHMLATARKARDTRPDPTFPADRPAQPTETAPGFLVMISNAGIADWLTVMPTAADAEDALRDHLMSRPGEREMVGWVVKVEAFLHHPEA